MTHLRKIVAKCNKYTHRHVCMYNMCKLFSDIFIQLTTIMLLFSPGGRNMLKLRSYMKGQTYIYAFTFLGRGVQIVPASSEGTRTMFTVLGVVENMFVVLWQVVRTREMQLQEELTHIINYGFHIVVNTLIPPSLY